MSEDIETEPVKAKLNLAQASRKIWERVRPFLWLILIVFFIVLYGYLLLRINSFSSTKPSVLQISSDYKATTPPAINPSIVKQLNNLQNTSVSVKALFNSARSNPF
ncbi:hypothetical protein M1512_03020 [Patescibacteria group bacterium]|jgi:hypothetical protein|nr:hypothetical protein [Patescibacteria group bacterium]